MSQEYAPGQRLGDYEILGVLGAGGMGKVYRVRNVISDRIEAMKILLPNIATQKELADRFLREIKLLASLNHPNIAALRTALTLDDQLVMIMEYVEGSTLSSRLHQGAIPPADAVIYVDQVLAALSYAHRLNIVHRDIKPANIMLTPQGVVKLMDFGIARSGGDRSLTMTGTTMGSLNYMPPEQVKGDSADARSDIYSLGVSLYEMVTGLLPFRGDSNYSVMAAHLQELPKPPILLRPGLPDSLNQIILMALAKEPDKRFQSADAFRAALKNVDPGATSFDASTQSTMSAGPPPVVHAPTVYEPSQPAAAAGPKAAPPPPASTRSQRGLYIALGALLVVGVLFAAGFYLPRRARTQANAEKSTPPAQSGSGKSSSSPPSDAASSQPSPPVAPETANSPPTPDPGNNPATTSPSPSGSAGGASKASQAAAQQQEEAAEAARAQAAAAAALEEAENHLDQLSGRASAIAQSLERLRNQQSAQGFGLRGDVVSAQQRMDTALSRAQSALQQQDAAKAAKYLQSAESEIEFLEKFLGR